MNNLYAYKTIFTINSLQSLNDFWSFLIFRLNLEQSEYTYDRFARLYNLLSEHKHELSENSVVYLILEESDEKFFLSIDTTLNEFLHQMTTRLEALNFSYLYESNLLSYTIDKKQVFSNNSTSLKTNNYTFMDPQDFEQMQRILEKINSKNYTNNPDVFSKDELDEYKTSFSNYSHFLRYYPQLSTVGNVVAEVSVIFSLYPKECLNLGNDFRMIVGTFFDKLTHWQNKLFLEGSEKLDFMDDVFKSDLSNIKSVLNLYDAPSNEKKKGFMDDVFDF